MMSKITIYHNPRCSKSRETLKLLREQGTEPEIVEYLKEVPGRETLRKIIMKLGIKPEELVRKSEAVYKERLKGLKLTDEEWLDVLTEHPQLIERPVVVRGNKAVIGRPPEKVLDLL